MLDHHQGRLWADHHHDFTRTVDHALGTVRTSFERLTARLYDAPWERVSGKRCGR